MTQWLLLIRRQYDKPVDDRRLHLVERRLCRLQRDLFARLGRAPRGTRVLYVRVIRRKGGGA